MCMNTHAVRVHASRQRRGLALTGSVVGAARELSLRHSSISRRIDALERALGVPLFYAGRRCARRRLASTLPSARAPCAATRRPAPSRPRSTGRWRAAGPRRRGSWRTRGRPGPRYRRSYPWPAPGRCSAAG
ncbi:LysR family transcriptional regulator [Corallococcus interemptor]|uniref:LysR family transcriptional regulator n=1 Tax=Corallococcus interemptor TaxID=2316720 RepID=A0A3A8QBE6_9BACT|nr:LysR family transcriptional regulator [Corallococcus sp. AB050B]RKH62072.1 LysR family transcriptional regulator [Corallococcus interemptor]